MTTLFIGGCLPGRDLEYRVAAESQMEQFLSSQPRTGVAGRA